MMTDHINRKLNDLSDQEHRVESEEEEEEEDENTITIEQVPINVTCAQLAHNLGELNIAGIREFDFYLLGNKLVLNESIITQCKLVKGAARQTKLINIKLYIEQDKRRIEIIDILKLRETKIDDSNIYENRDQIKDNHQSPNYRRAPSETKFKPHIFDDNNVSHNHPSVKHGNSHEESKSLDKKSIEPSNFASKKKESSPLIKPKQEKTPRSISSNNHDVNIYDSVTIVQIQPNSNEPLTQDVETSPRNPASEVCKSQPPPPLPLHQSDRWELELYNLADETFSTLIKQPKSYTNQQDTVDLNYDIDKLNGSRKSSSSLRNDIISLVKPSFTTIDGDEVVEDLTLDQSLNDSSTAELDSLTEMSTKPMPGGTIARCPSQLNRIRLGSLNLGDNYSKPPTSNLFDSPIRSRGGKDNILRTQSVRRNPAPEKLYDFILADLVKRGYLVKPGAIKNHSRWFVLKNFHLYSYKCESDERTKASPNLSLKLDSNCQIVISSQSSEASFPFRIISSVKTLNLIASSAQSRDDWIRTLTVAINMSDIEPESLRKECSIHDGLVSITRQGHAKRCYATLINHVLFFLKSLTDPTPLSYISMKKSKIREVTDTHDYDSEEQNIKRNSLDCSLAVYPKYSLTLDPVYITIVGQQETDKWFYYLSMVSGVDQSHGTPYERTLTKLMVNNSINNRRYCHDGVFGPETGSNCLWREQSVMLYSVKPIVEPLTSLPNETLKAEAIELFKSILLFTQVPIEPVAIDYHVSLLQNCLGRFLKHPELRNEFYAQLIKQCTLVVHSCGSSKISSESSNCSPTDPRFSLNSSSHSSSECQFVTDFNQLDSINSERGQSSLVNQLVRPENHKKRSDSLDGSDISPTQSELLQVVQILAVAVSLDLPRGRIRWWLLDFLRKLANPEISIGKYALYTINAIDRAASNGSRSNVPSRTEIMSILLRNPFDHSSPHSLPVNFCDGSYHVVESDGSTTVEEFLASMSKSINIRHSSASDFYLFANDPSGSKELHILEPQRKVMDVIGWWEQIFRKNHSGRYQSTKFIKLICRKRLVLRPEVDETDKERLLIVHQLNQEVITEKLPLNETLVAELGAIMAQLTHGDFRKLNHSNLSEEKLDKIVLSFYPNRSSQGYRMNDPVSNPRHKLVEHWVQLSGKPAQDCVRIYLNCIRRLRLDG